MSTIDLQKRIRARFTLRNISISDLAYFLLTVVPILIIIGIPLAFFLWGSVWSTAPGLGGHFTLEGYRRIVTSQTVYDTIANTFIIAGFGTVLSLSLGIIFMVFALKTNGYGRRLVPIIVIAQYLQPSYIAALSWQYFAGPSLGILNQVLGLLPFVESPVLNVFSLWGIIVVGGAHYAGIVYLLTSGGIKAIPVNLEEIGWINGGSITTITRRITLPLVLPGLAISTVLVFTRFMQSFGIPIILGIPEEIFVIATLMFQALGGFSQDFTLAAALGVFLLSITLLGLFFQRRISGAKEKYETLTGSGSGTESMRFDLGKWRLPVSAIVLGLLFFLYVVPYLILVVSSFQSVFRGIALAEVTWTLDNYLTLFVGDFSESFYRSVKNTILIAVLGGLFGMTISTLSSYVIVKSDSKLGGWLDYMTLAPAAIPGIIFGIALLWLFLTYNPLGIMGTIWVLVFAFGGKFLMYGTRAVNSSFRAIGEDLESAARVSGAGIFSIFRRIFAPLISPGFAAGFIIYAIDITKVLTIPVLLSSQKNEMIQVLLFRLVNSAHVAVVSAVAVIMTLSIFAIYATVYTFTDIDITSL